jgi:nitroimidazol reductase NimA-like FMN-containing flavoprotein (pyridoxamine 5'-phosphate oxidase superfamily)
VTAGAGDRPAELFQLDRSTCLALLGTHHVGRLVIGGSEPAVVPVNYRLVDATISFRTTHEGRAGRPSPDPVLFEVDMFDERTHSGWSVIVRGRLLASTPGTGAVAVESWAPGRDRWMAVPVDEVTGRLLRGAVDAPVHPAGGYL